MTVETLTFDDDIAASVFPTTPEQARDDGMRAVTEASDASDKAVVDAAILAVIRQHGVAGANEARELIPEIRHRNLVGARVNSLRMRGLIVPVDEVRSTDVGTHGKKIWRYRLGAA